MTLARVIESLQRKEKVEAMAKRPEKQKTPRGICRVCACTDEEACEGGCEWADKSQTVCSTCVGLLPETIAEKRASAVEMLTTQHAMLVAELEGLADDLSKLMARLTVVRGPFSE